MLYKVLGAAVLFALVALAARLLQASLAVILVIVLVGLAVAGGVALLGRSGR